MLAVSIRIQPLEPFALPESAAVLTIYEHMVSILEVAPGALLARNQGGGSLLAIAEPVADPVDPRPWEAGRLGDAACARMGHPLGVGSRAASTLPGNR